MVFKRNPKNENLECRILKNISNYNRYYTYFYIFALYKKKKYDYEQRHNLLHRFRR